MKKCVNPRAVEIQRRFFDALDTGISLGAVPSLKAFCDAHGLNRTKYSRVRTSLAVEGAAAPYKAIDIDALAALCSDFGVSAEWLLLGRGRMLSKDVEGRR